MPSLDTYSEKSSLMKANIKVQHGDKVKTYKIDLTNAMDLNENMVNHHIRKYPKYYSFLLMLYHRINKHFEEFEQDLKRLRSEKHIYYKSKKGPYYIKEGKYPSEDIVKSYIELDESYISLSNKLLSIRHERDKIDRILKAYETRKDLLQSLSANIRRETK